MPKTERITFYSLLALLIWLPIPLASNRPWAWSIMEIWVALQTLALLVHYRGTLPWQQLLAFKWLLGPLVLFQLWTLLQIIPVPLSTLFWISPKTADIYHQATNSVTGLTITTASLSLDREQTFISLLKGVSYFLLALNVCLLVNNGSRVKWVVSALVISGTLQAFYGAMLVLLDIKSSPVFGFALGDIATGSFVYKNHLANYLMMVLSLGIGLIVSQMHASPSQNWRIRFVRWIQAMLSNKMLIRLCLVIMVIALVMTRSRMGNTAFFAATVIGSILVLLLYKHRPRAFTVLIVSILAIDTIVVGTLFGLEKVKQRLEQTSLDQEDRDQVVYWGLDIIRDFPLTGTGAGSFYSTFQAYQQEFLGIFYDHAHNDYLQFAIESGLPATLMLGAMVLLTLWYTLWTLRNRHSQLMKGVAFGCCMAIIGMLIHISVDFNLQPPANAATFIVILCLATIVRQMPRDGWVTANKAGIIHRK
ncbi:O-antigen ligase family protein [Photobacterium sagamiensis]|uniref:O-antigen ligase family protein n=1 Tax=Photobacterium sagamiensis TaxID=2910241 RepID=UPI003D143760